MVNNSDVYSTFSTRISPPEVEIKLEIFATDESSTVVHREKGKLNPDLKISSKTKIGGTRKILSINVLKRTVK